ncbi:MAG: tetratricopeptide repeat protein [Spirochaetota bacterium]
MLFFILCNFSLWSQSKQKLKLYVNEFVYKGNPTEKWFAAGFRESLLFDLRKLKSLEISDRETEKQAEKIILQKIRAGAKTDVTRDPAGIISSDYLLDFILNNRGRILEFKVRIRKKPKFKIIKRITIEGNRSNILDIQNQLISAVVNSLKIKYTLHEKDWILGDHLYYSQPFQLYSQGLQYLNQKEYAKALSYFHKVLPTNPDYWPLFDAIGFAYLQLDDYENALKFYLGAKKILDRKKGKYTRLYYQTLNNIGISYHYNLQERKAIAYFSQALQIQKKLRIEKSNDAAYSIKNIAIAYDKLEMYESALTYYTESKKKKEKLGLVETHDYADILSRIGIIFHKKQEWDKSLSYLNRAEKIWRKLELNSIEAYAFTIAKKANILKSKEKYQEALQLYKEYLLLADKLSLAEKEETQYVVYDIGNIYFHQGKLLLALSHYQSYLKKNSKSNPNMLSCLHNIAFIYSKLGEPCESESYFVKLFNKFPQSLTFEDQIVWKKQEKKCQASVGELE